MDKRLRHDLGRLEGNKKTELCLNRFATLAMKIGLENSPGQRQ